MFATMVVAASLCSGDWLLCGLQAHAAPQPPPEAKEVSIDNFNFSPATLTVAPGTTVTWVNKDDVPHNVTSTEKQFASKTLDTDERFSFTFKDPGTYDYYCTIHPKMTGKVVVQ
jgi:amicyanin